MNKVILTGRLTAAPELRTTRSGKSVSEFSLAVDRIVNGEKQVDFIRCTAWDKQAELLCKYCGQGHKIAVVGALRVEKYTDAKGNERYKTYVLVSEIEFLQCRTPNREHENGQIPEVDDDLPF